MNIGGFTNRNIIIDKPLLYNKRKLETINQQNETNYSRANLQDDATSIQSPANNNNPSESDEDTRTPDVQLRPVKREANTGPNGTAKDTSALALEYSEGDLTTQMYQAAVNDSMSEGQGFINQPEPGQLALPGYNQLNDERASGFPRPDKYNNYYVNQYSIPKSFA